MNKVLLAVVVLIFFFSSVGCNKSADTNVELIKKGCIIQVSVNSLSEAYNYQFTDTKSINNFVNYFDFFELSSEHDENPDEYNGTTWVITFTIQREVNALYIILVT